MIVQPRWGGGVSTANGQSLSVTFLHTVHLRKEINCLENVPKFTPISLV